MPISSLGWANLASGYFHITCENIVQRFRTRNLPRRLPLSSLAHLTCIITGATSGIGLETAKQLAEAGAHVVLACRNTVAAWALVNLWQKQNESSLNVEVMELNLLSLSSVRSFAAAWESRQCLLHVLINNAGIFSMSAPQRFSQDGYEEHLQVNHLAPALLTMLLLPSLFRAAPSRIVNVSSEMQCFGVINPDDFRRHTPERREYNSLAAYSTSKLAQIYFSSVLENNLPIDAGIHVICVNPGCVMTNVTRTLPKLVQAAYRLLGFFSLSSIEGARSVLYCATNSEVCRYAEALRDQGWSVCAYYSSDCKAKGTARQAQNVGLALKVWEKTNEAIGLSNELSESLLVGSGDALAV